MNVVFTNRYVSAVLGTALCEEKKITFCRSFCSPRKRYSFVWFEIHMLLCGMCAC